MGQKKQTAEHVAKRVAAMVETRKQHPWKAGRPANTPDVLWSKVDKRAPQECWPWKGHVHGDGYGRTWINGKGYFAHRVIYLLQYPGSITLNAPRRRNAWGFLRHKCDNPLCCNPRHLEPGTHLDNMQDKVERGRSQIYEKGRGPRCKLTDENIFWLRIQKKCGATKKALALLYDVSEATISGALYGRHYAPNMREQEDDIPGP